MKNDYSRQQSFNKYKEPQQFFDRNSSITKENNKDDQFIQKNSALNSKMSLQSSDFDQDLVDKHKRNCDVSSVSSIGNIYSSFQLRDMNNFD